MAERLLNLFSTFAFNELYWRSSEKERHLMRKKIADDLPELAQVNHLYGVYPARQETDFLIWSAWRAYTPEAAAKAFTQYQAVTDDWRRFLAPVQTLWGFTRVSMYARGKSEQDMDPFDEKRCAYLVSYPFSKTKEWYQMSMDARQGQMNEHIKLGKQYPDIKQLLLYSFGLQDHEFVVSYEMDDMVRFSELVNQLRSTEARRHTLLDAPIITGIYRTSEEFVR